MRRTLAILTLSLLASAASAADDEETAPGDAEAVVAAETLALNPLSGLAKSTLDGFRDAPLFTPSRVRPAPPPAPIVAEAPPPPPPAEEDPPEPPTIKLSGIVEGPDGAVAYVSKEGTETVEQLRLGDQVDGWLVSSIDPAALKLTLDEREQEYRLFVPSADSAASSGDDDEDASDTETDKSSGDDASDAGDASSDGDGDEEDKSSSETGPQTPPATQEADAAREAQRASQRRHRAAPRQEQD